MLWQSNEANTFYITGAEVGTFDNKTKDSSAESSGIEDKIFKSVLSTLW